MQVWEQMPVFIICLLKVKPNNYTNYMNECVQEMYFEWHHLGTFLHSVNILIDKCWSQKLCQALAAHHYWYILCALPVYDVLLQSGTCYSSLQRQDWNRGNHPSLVSSRMKDKALVAVLKKCHFILINSHINSLSEFSFGCQNGGGKKRFSEFFFNETEEQ